MAEQTFRMKSKNFDWSGDTLAECIEKVARRANNNWSSQQGDVVLLVSKDKQTAYALEVRDPGEGVIVKEIGAAYRAELERKYHL